ncbi:MAG: penicillin-binding protein 2 [Lachnospiraceae bacterium]|nr:penicillin-binding protein 2 [Lachnospiraceae bacterium]
MKASRNTNKRVFTKTMQEKLAITVLVITLALFALVMVLYNLIKHNQEDYNQIVLDHQNYSSQILPYRRGEIMDRNGTYLAVSEQVYNLIIDPKVILSDKDKYLTTTVSVLSQTFGYNTEELIKLINENEAKSYINYEKQITQEQKEAFEANSEAAQGTSSKQKVAGVWFEPQYKRVYPYGTLASTVIGFSYDNGAKGMNGIEQYYNDQLTGINGREYGYLNEETNLERVIKEAENGRTIVSTIDINLQKIAEKYIDEWEAGIGSKMSAAIVMNPQNGEILAMATKNRYDLNDPRNLEGQFTDEEIRAMGRLEAVDDYKRKNRDRDLTITEEEVSQHYSEEEIYSLGQQVAWNKIWRNFCVSDSFEPGSPSKIFTVAAAMEEGYITGNESIECEGVLEVGGHQIHCVNRNGHGSLTITESLMESCNVVMMRLASMTGGRRFSKYQEIFGFGQKTNIDLPGEADTSTLIYQADQMRSSNLATNSFGQNFNCTMVQMAAAFASVINGGSYYEPHVVKQILNDQGSVVKKIEPVLVRETVSEGTAAFLKTALEKTVSEGTGKAAQVEGYAVGGKTGTAEKYPRSAENYLVSFIGFAPADNPQIMVYVAIDTPNLPGKEQAHSSFATQIVQKILTESLPYLNIFPATDTEQLPEELREQLPEEDGILDQETGTVDQTEPETEPRVYATDEYIVGEAEGEEALPGFPAGLEELDLPENLTGAPEEDPAFSGEPAESTASSQGEEAGAETGNSRESRTGESSEEETS